MYNGKMGNSNLTYINTRLIGILEMVNSDLTPINTRLMRKLKMGNSDLTPINTRLNWQDGELCHYANQHKVITVILEYSTNIFIYNDQ